MNSVLQCICCMNIEDLIELFGEETNGDGNYAEKLQFSLNIEIKSEKYNVICQSCARRVDDCVVFRKQILDNLTLLESVVEINQQSDDEKEEMYLKYEYDDDNIEPDFKNSEVFGTLAESNQEILENNKETRIKVIVRAVKRVDPVADDNKHDYSIEEETREHRDELNNQEYPDDLNTKAKQKHRMNVMDAMPYTIDESERECRECGQEFPSYGSLKIHYKCHFGQYTCNVCKKRYMTAGSLSKHKTTHKEGPFSCSLCGKEFRYLNTLNSHKTLKHRPLPFKCGKCTDSFQTFAQRLAHQKKVHNQPNKVYKCPHCDQYFANPVYRFNHVQNVHVITLVTCELCGGSFKKNYIKKHMFKKHSIGKGWQCSICPAKRPTKADLRNHMLIHTEESRYSCKLCNKGFTTRCALKYHIEKHIAKNEFDGDPDDITICKYQVGDLDMGEITRCGDTSVGPKVKNEEVVEEVGIEEYIIFKDEGT